MSDVPGPSVGPCSGWLNADDVQGCCSLTLDAPTLEAVAEAASAVMFEVSGRQFPGLCTRAVRPCRDLTGCGAFDVASGLQGPWTWAWGAYPGGWGWVNQSGTTCGCSPLPTVPLAGYPVRQITEVLIDGEVVDPDTYRLDLWREAVRVADPGPPVVARYWPSCQNLALPTTEHGTFQITYLYGQDVPQLGRDAACQLAGQLAAACAPDQVGPQNKLPQGVTSITRQGVKIDRGVLANWFDPAKPTGLTAVDAFLRSYWKTRAGSVGAILSPDIPQYPRPVYE